MKIGTKSILWGIHNPIIHTFFVTVAWIIIYRTLPNLAEFVAIIIHDLGLWGQPNIDGPEGERHPEVVFDKVKDYACKYHQRRHSDFLIKVANLVIGHSGWYAAKHGLPLSKLYYADKLANALYPTTLYLLLGILSGEIKEYRQRTADGKYQNNNMDNSSLLHWLLTLRANMTMVGLKLRKVNFKHESY